MSLALILFAILIRNLLNTTTIASQPLFLLILPSILFVRYLWISWHSSLDESICDRCDVGLVIEGRNHDSDIIVSISALVRNVIWWIVFMQDKTLNDSTVVDFGYWLLIYPIQYQVNLTEFILPSQLSNSGGHTIIM